MSGIYMHFLRTSRATFKTQELIVFRCQTRDL